LQRGDLRFPLREQTSQPVLRDFAETPTREVAQVRHPGVDVARLLDRVPCGQFAFQLAFQLFIRQLALTGKEQHVGFERRRFPWNLLAVRREAHRQAHPLQRVLDSRFADRQLAHQMAGVEPIDAAHAIRGDAAGRRGVRQQAARRRVELRETFLRGHVAVTEWIVATGIQHDHKRLALRFRQVAQQRREFEALCGKIGRRVHPRIDGQQEVAPIKLHAVARVVEEHELDVGLPRALGERSGRFAQPLAIDIDSQIHAESGLAQQRVHGPRIVGRVGQPCLRVGAIADHERDPRRIGGRLRTQRRVGRERQHATCLQQPTAGLVSAAQGHRGPWAWGPWWRVTC
jgi:hypothetical protein